MLDGVLLKKLEAEYPGLPEEDAMDVALEEVSTLFPSMRPVPRRRHWRLEETMARRLRISQCRSDNPAVVLSCAGGGGILGATDFVQIVAATDHDWKALDCVRENEMEV